MIVFMLQRVDRVHRLDHFLVAPTVDKSDDILANLVCPHEFDCFRGDVVESFTRDELLKANHAAQLPTDREHVTPYIRRNKSIFRHMNIVSDVDRSSDRWTVDYPDDLDFVRAR